MTDSRAALKRARDQITIDSRRIRNLGSNGGDVSVGRREIGPLPIRFVGGFALGSLVGALVALVFTLWRRPNIRQLLARAGGLRGILTGFVQRMLVNRGGSQGRVVSINDSGGGSAIEREIRGGTEGAASISDETDSFSRP